MLVPPNSSWRNLKALHKSDVVFSGSLFCIGILAPLLPHLQGELGSVIAGHVDDLFCFVSPKQRIYLFEFLQDSVILVNLDEYPIRA